MLRWCAVVVVLLSTQFVFAQSAAMGFPHLVVRDADGKVMAQVMDMGSGSGADQMFARIVLDVDGIPAVFTVKATQGWLTSGKNVYFSLTDCQGNAAINPPAATGFESYWQTSFAVVGPDSITGTYRVFQSTSPTPSSFSYLSSWDQQCNNHSGMVSMAPAEEVIPNPLEGFHGPTDAEPERVLTFSGGDRIILSPTPAPTPAPTPTPPPP